jgi:transcriptional antiterminator RfaH
MAPFWAVARTCPQREATALYFLKLAGFTTYLPRIMQTRTVRRRVVDRVSPLFPSYVFVLITLQWHAVNNAPGIGKLIMDGDHPAHLADAVIDEIRQREHRGFVALPPEPARFSPGQQVRITGGPFEGHRGLWAGQAAQDRERVLLGLLGQRDVPVEVPADDLVASHG